MSAPNFNTSPHGARIGRQFSAAAKLRTKDLDTITQRIITEFRNLNRKQIDSWRQALQAARDPYYPMQYLLQDLYEDLSTDGHLKALWQLRFMATLGYMFEIYDDATGDADDSTTKLFRAGWFYEFMEMALSHEKEGYTVLELLNPSTMQFDIIPRRNVLPQKKMVVLSVTDTEGVYYGEGFEDRIIEVGKPDYLGIMNDIVPQLIWKRNAQQSWAEFSEKFGMPMIVATTNKTNPKDLDKVQAVLDALGEASRAVLPVGNTIDIKPFAGKDSYNVYEKQIERCNSEIAKPIVGGTMTTDNGSSRSQSEVHERNLDDKIAESDRNKLTFLVNGKLIPLMRMWGWPVPEGKLFRFSESFDMDLSDHWSIVNQALLFYDIPMEWVSKTFNFPIDGVKALPPPTPPEGAAPANPPPVNGKKKPAASFFG